MVCETVNTLTYKDSWVKFQDCIEGMKELDDKSIDLCLTDPPYNNNIRVTSKENNPQRFNRYKTPYSDKKTHEEYIQWCELWFNEIKRVCKKGVLFTGNKNLKTWWVEIDSSLDLLWWYDPSKQGASSNAHFNHTDPILTYGFKQKYPTNVIYFPCYKKADPYSYFIHPCPKPLELIKEYLIKPLNPSSVLDPFMGSGTTLEACIQLDIPCYGFELMEEYRVDMEKRIERSKYYKKPKKLDDYL